MANSRRYGSRVPLGVAAVRSWATLVAAGVFGFFVAAMTEPAQAVPSFARQTGQPCAACHTAFPELTPFGRRFKLGGYTLGGGDSNLPPVAAMIIPGFTHTAASQDSPPSPGLKTNDNVVTQQVTGFLAGKLYGDLGSFIQVTGDPVGGGVALDASDVRYVKTFQVFGKDTFFGIDVNNTPTVEDPWNTYNAWGFPEVSSSVAAFSTPGNHIDALAQQVAGVGVYAFWNDMLYANVTAYGGLNQPTLNALGQAPGPSPDVQHDLMPYWRVALEPHWGDHYLMVGTMGMYGETIPGGQYGNGVDKYLDIGFDSQYQYDGDPYSVTIKASNVYERQQFNASYVLGSASNVDNWQNNFKLNGSFVWDHTYSLSAGYFNVTGSSDTLFDTGIYGGPGVVNSPTGDGLVFDAAYLPFSKGAPWPYATWNARLGVQYTTYLRLYGGATNFDGAGPGGTHNANGNNTLFLYAMLAF